ncbi:hypothetical protein AVEN_51721-1 [Araneus ventricosus]|uniref:Uncharacterized protein n=1 Tax=Araneus ventricosus TaxID=182803 RepID=A0A4Y2GGK3_ARAVE|nr:hypothetical protein AVEN_51721-1 [Araneus ventricosus]
MNPNSAVAEKVKSIDNFILARKKELSLCKMLLHVKSSIKKLKGEEFSENQRVIEFAEAAIQECEHALNAFSDDPKSVGKYIKSFNDGKKAVILIEYLKKETNFFRSKMIYADDILDALEKATTKFKETAD